jgi:uncharacterized coiled-coil protein SlyX
VAGWKFPAAKMHQVEERLHDSDKTLRDVADVILELRANTERLEDILKRLREESDDSDGL